MKIVCDACQAKYSISDDKVQGKVFKIRCKKCSNIIVVRGGAGAAEQPAAPTQEKETKVYDYGYDGGDQAPSGDESVWHVVINQDQVGPMTAAEVQQRFAAGEIDGETYAWREGFADWLPLSQVDAFAAYVASGRTTAAVSGGGGAAAVSAMFGAGSGDEAGTVRSDPGDLFASASASSTAQHDDDGGDLFGTSKPSSSRSTDANAKLRGERNENSVLFSLNNLAQLASNQPPPASASTSSTPSGHATGAQGGEGSGLIDIRSMANAYLGAPGGAARPAAASIGSIDDLPVFGGGGFSEPAVIVPTGAARRDNKMMYALIGSLGLLAVAAVIIVIVLLKGGDNKGNTQQVATAEKVAAGSDDKKEPAATGSDDKDKPTPTDTAAKDPKPADGSAAAPADPKPADTTGAKEPPKPADTVAVKETPKPKDPKPAKARDPRPASTGGSVPKEPKPPKEPVVKADTGGGGCDEVSCVLNNYEGACCAKYKKGGKAPAGGGGGGSAPKSDLPDALDRTMISEGVGKVKARVMACGDKSSAKGQVKVSVKVNPDGKVGSVSIKATPDPGLGSCVSGAMQKASFAKTSGGGSFSYPFVF
jgi:predicted Zn finger-like uncharacterized protein